MAALKNIQCGGGVEWIPFQTTITNQGYGGSLGCSLNLGFPTKNDQDIAFPDQNQTFGLSLGWHGMSSNIKTVTSGIDDISLVRPEILADLPPLEEIKPLNVDLGRIGLISGHHPWEKKETFHRTTSITRYLGFWRAVQPVHEGQSGREALIWEVSKSWNGDITHYFSDSFSIHASFGLLYGALYENDRSEFNRLLLTPSLSLSFGLFGEGPSETEPNDAENQLPTSYSFFELAFLAYDWLISYFVRKVIITPNSDIDALGITEGKVEPETKDVPPILGSVFVLTSADKNFHNAVLRSNTAGKAMLIGTKLAGALGSMIDNAFEEPLPQLQVELEDNRPRNVNGYIAGFADGLTVANTALYYIFDADLTNKDQMMDVAIARLVLNGGIMALGGIVSSFDPDADGAKILSTVGAQALTGLALAPFPLKKSNPLKNARYSLFLPNLSLDESNFGPSMGGRITHQQNEDGKITAYSSATFITPATQLGDHRSYQRTSVAAAFGASFTKQLSEKVSFEAQAGLSLELTYPKQLAAAGLEGAAEFEYQLADGKAGIAAGAYLSFHKIAGPGAMLNIAPTLSLRFHDDFGF